MPVRRRLLPALISSVALASLTIAMPANAAHHHKGHHHKGHHQKGGHGNGHHGNGHHGNGHHGIGHGHHHLSLRVGAAVKDVPWSKATGQIGNLQVTRLFYPHALPKTFSREGIPEGVMLIVSYKQPNTNVMSYVRSIPPHQRVQLVFHHEPEGDYANGSTFVSQFNSQEKLAKSADPHIRFAFIAGGYQYGSPRRNGYSGSFIPPHADRYYLDSYQYGTSSSPIRPASVDPSVQRYLALVAAKGHRFNGFTEYGRGAVTRSHPLTAAMVQQRVRVFAEDSRYLKSLRGIRVWAYWYTTDLASGTQWRLTDRRSQEAWRVDAAATK